MRLILLVWFGLTVALFVAACERTQPPPTDNGNGTETRDPEVDDPGSPSDETPHGGDVADDLIVTSIGFASLVSHGGASTLVAFFGGTEPTQAARYITDFYAAGAGCVIGADDGETPSPDDHSFDVLVDAGASITVRDAEGATFLTAWPSDVLVGVYVGTTEGPRPSALTLSIPGGVFPPFDTPAFPPLRRLSLAGVTGADGQVEAGSTLRWAPAPPIASGFTEVTFTLVSPTLPDSLVFCSAPDGNGAVTIADAVDVEGNLVDLAGLTFEVVAVERAPARFHVNAAQASMVLLRSSTVEFGSSLRLAMPPDHALQP